MKRMVVAGISMCVLVTMVLVGAGVLAQDARKSARPRTIEVDEEAWYKLNKDLLTMQDELVKAKTEAKVLQAELEKEKKVRQAQASGVVKDKTQARVYRVLKLDSLWKIAVKYYNDPYKWRWIYKANMNQIEDPNMIYPEQILDIPHY
jgi:hypothetical protein